MADHILTSGHFIFYLLSHSGLGKRYEGPKNDVIIILDIYIPASMPQNMFDMHSP